MDQALNYSSSWYTDFDEATHPMDRITKELEFTTYAEMVSIAPSGRSLDIGTATGRYLQASLDRGYDAIGIDYSAEAVHITQAHLASAGHDQARVMLMDARELGFPAAHFSLVTCMMATIAHIPDFDRALSEISRVLAPGGLAILSIWQSRSPCGNFIGNRFLSVNPPETNLHLIDVCRAIGSIEHRLADVGLNVIRTIETVIGKTEELLPYIGCAADLAIVDRQLGMLSAPRLGELAVHACTHESDAIRLRHLACA
jgi:SAM-dependent methyltransferase